MKKSTLILLIVAVAAGLIAVISAFLVKQHKDSLMSLTEGEKISYLNLEKVGESESKTVSASDLKDYSIIFIFQRPCVPCNKNVHMWNRITSCFKEKANFYGVILDSMEKAYNYSQETKNKFGLYIPKDIEKAIQKLRIKINMPHTIVCKGRKILYIRLGELSGQEYFDISKLLTADI